MAIIYGDAALTPSKAEVIAQFIDERLTVPPGEVQLEAAYRFDDPEGVVGIEAHIVRRGPLLLHIPLTYRPEPVPELEQHLVATMEHSALGTRFIYDACGDPVALAQYRAALAGKVEAAAHEYYEGEQLVRTAPTSAVVRRSGPRNVPIVDVRLERLLRTAPVPAADGPAQLIAAWDRGMAIVATAG